MSSEPQSTASLEVGSVLHQMKHAPDMTPAKWRSELSGKGPSEVFGEAFIQVLSHFADEADKRDQGDLAQSTRVFMAEAYPSPMFLLSWGEWQSSVTDAQDQDQQEAGTNERTEFRKIIQNTLDDVDTLHEYRFELTKPFIPAVSPDMRDASAYVLTHGSRHANDRSLVSELHQKLWTAEQNPSTLQKYLQDWTSRANQSSEDQSPLERDIKLTLIEYLETDLMSRKWQDEATSEVA